MASLTKELVNILIFFFPYIIDPPASPLPQYQIPVPNYGGVRLFIMVISISHR